MQIMNTIKAMLALSLAMGVLTTVGIKPVQSVPLPDLSIVGVNEYNTTARVLVRNNSPVWSGACFLRAYRQAGGWVPIAQINVPAIPPFQTRWVSVSAAAIPLNPTMYFVDATGIVAEADEMNNRFILF